MADTLFGSVAPIWSTMPSPGTAWFPTAMAVGNRSIGGVPSGISAATNGPVAGTVLGDPFGFNTGMVPGQVGPGLGTRFPLVVPTSLGAVAFPTFDSPEIGPSAATALVAAVAMRRGQPLGPTNDQEMEDFICDALDLLPGAAEVEVRCEAGRAMLTGSVHHKRIKRDVGEIAWAIPTINDVQNNVTISPRRRSRTPRETEGSPVGPGRKQT